MKNIQKIIGFILLFPPIFSVLLFTINTIVDRRSNITKMSNLSSNWTGDYAISGTSGAEFSSNIPIYFGLMAIAGAMLLKNSSEK